MYVKMNSFSNFNKYTLGTCRNRLNQFLSFRNEYINKSDLSKNNISNNLEDNGKIR
jgi:hypothetical protein